LPSKYCLGFIGILISRNNHILIAADNLVGAYILIVQQKLIVKIGFKFSEHVQWIIYQINQFIASAFFVLRLQFGNDQFAA